jgi:predicted peptidase
LLDDISVKYRIDPDRICVTGLSMGGFGTWALALAHPDRFSAIAPICGGGDPPDASRLKKLPIWAFHGGKDDTVPTELSVKMVEAVHKAGGHAHLTIFPNDGHNSWTDAYDTEALYAWLLAQKRGQKEVVTPGVPKG